MLILYSKDPCVQCGAVKRWLRRPDRELVEGVDYVVKDIVADIEAHHEVMDLGYGAVPVVLLPDGTHFYGFDTTKLEKWRGSL